MRDDVTEDYDDLHSKVLIVTFHKNQFSAYVTNHQTYRMCQWAVYKLFGDFLTLL